MTGEWTPERACLGAWARWLLPIYPNIKIGVEQEDGPTAMRLRQLGQLLTVTVTHPWEGRDPRGPENETFPMTYVNGRWVKGATRAPCVLATIIHRREAAQPMVVDRHAQLARIRLQRELARGYAIVQEGPMAPELFGDRKQLAERTTCGGVLGGHVTSYALWGNTYYCRHDVPLTEINATVVTTGWSWTHD